MKDILLAAVFICSNGNNIEYRDSYCQDGWSEQAFRDTSEAQPLLALQNTKELLKVEKAESLKRQQAIKARGKKEQEKLKNKKRCAKINAKIAKMEEQLRKGCSAKKSEKIKDSLVISKHEQRRYCK